MKFGHIEQDCLYEEACKALSVSKFNNYIIEIGSFRGSSAIPLSTAIKDCGGAGLICIDPFCGYYDEGLKEVMKQNNLGDSTLPDFKKSLGALLKYVIPIALPSEMALPFLYKHNIKANMIHIDGAHDNDSVMQDLKFSIPLLTYGGWLLCHDASWFPKVLDEFTFKYNAKKELLCGDSFAKITM